MRRLRPLFAVPLLLGVLGAGLLSPVARVAAADIPRLSGPVTDQTGRLSGHEGDVGQAIDDLLKQHDVQLFVLFVSTTGDLNAPDFAQETARQNSLGANDALLLVAIDDRTDAIWVSDGLDQITDAEIDQIIGDVLEPRLRDGDFSGAVVDSAAALGDAASGAITPTPVPATAAPTAAPTQAPEEGASGGGGGGILTAIVALVLLVGGAIILYGWWRARSMTRRDTEERDRRTGQLAREANAALIATDERIRDAGQEVGFVEAEYGADETEPLRAAIATAQAELKAAFGVRQRLDDGIPEPPEEREQMLAEIVARTKKAQGALDAETARIQRLRDLERDAPAILDKLPGRIDEVESRLTGADTAMTRLRAYPDSAWAPVSGNVEEARKGLAGARAAVDKARVALASDKREAARQVRTAEEGVTGAAALLDAVDKLSAQVHDAEARVPQELAAAQADMDAARAAVPNAALDPRIAAAESRLASARADAEPRDDPILGLKAATEARRVAGETLAAVRQDAAQRARLVATLDASLTTARADVDRAADFIASRRSGVGRRARTRLAEAEASLERAEALRESDPTGAIETAKHAERMAEEAYNLAREDFDGWNNGGPPWGGTGGGGGRGSDVAGAILGGIIGGILSGGGRGGGWGGSPWGSSGPFGGGGGWGGGGGFGGGGGLGGFGGGGGGRSRGGRW